MVRKITFDEDYVQTIENQQIAQEKIQTAEFDSQAAAFDAQAAIREAEGIKEKNILLAEARAEARRVEALANAAAIVVEAAAEAEAIELQGSALRANRDMLQWTFIQEWDGVLPVFMTDSGILPILPLDGIVK